MILSVGFDSCLKKRYYLDEYSQFGDNQIISQEYDLGGKSINTGRILKNLNVDVFNTGFLGGLNGQFIFNGLKDLGIHNEFVQIRDETPNIVSVYKNERFILRLKEANPRITREEIEVFYKLYEEIVYKYKYICGLGQTPDSIPGEIYFELIRIAKKYGRKLILDTSGKELEYGIRAIPYMLKLRLEDLEDLSKIKINFEAEIIRIGYSYIEKGIEVIIIDLDEKGSIVLLKDCVYKLEIPNSRYKLSEDRGFFVSGYVFGLIKNYDIEIIMKLGQAMRIAYDDNHINSVDMSDIKKIMGNIEIRKINY